MTGGRSGYLDVHLTALHKGTRFRRGAFIMSYEKIYKEIQSLTAPISTKLLKDRAMLYSSIKTIKEQWSSVIEAENLRGFYIEGPLGPPIPLLDNEALIGLSRAMCTGHQGKYYRRFVFTKELMHVFDTPDEKTDTAEKFDRQIDKFGNPDAKPSEGFRSEAKAFWRALGVLCPESKRLEYKSELDADKVSIEVVAASLRLPTGFVRELFRTDFAEIIKGVSK